MSQEQQLEYNTIDLITESMLEEERQLPYQGHDGFTPELKSILTRIKYYRLLLRQANGVLLNKSRCEQPKQERIQAGIAVMHKKYGVG